MFLESLNRESSSLLSFFVLEEVKKLGGSLFFCWVQRGFVRDEQLAGATKQMIKPPQEKLMLDF